MYIGAHAPNAHEPISQDKVAVITGGGGGIGKAAAARLLEEGARVVLSGTRRSVLEAAQAELDPDGTRSALHAGHITGRADAQALVAHAIERFGAVDVLVNSTGIFRPVPFEEQTEEHFEEALGSILRPTFWVSQAVVAPMRERGGGAIVNVGSMWALDAIATTPTSAYSAAQAGRHVLTKNLALELAADGIRVNTVALAFVETPAYNRFMTPGGGAGGARGRQRLPSARPARPAGGRRRGGAVPGLAGRGLDHGHDAAGGRWRAGRAQPGADAGGGGRGLNGPARRGGYAASASGSTPR